MGGELENFFSWNVSTQELSILLLLSKSLFMSLVRHYTSKVCVLVRTIFFFQSKSQIMSRHNCCCDQMCSF